MGGILRNRNGQSYRLSMFLLITGVFNENSIDIRQQITYIFVSLIVIIKVKQRFYFHLCDIHLRKNFKHQLNDQKGERVDVTLPKC